MTFERFLHPDFQDFVSKLTLQGFELAVVGGTVRDFFLGNTNKHDYDCEIRKRDTSDINWDELSVSDESLELLPYKIIKYSHDNYVCELSMPRIETFDGTLKHKNFVAKFDPEMSYEKSVTRRDFTVNGMMYVFCEGYWSFIDPLNGKDALGAKILKPCSTNFAKDPVRLLRAIRFSIKDGFDLDLSIYEAFKNYELSNFPLHYLQLESLKSKKPILFITKLCSMLNLEIEDPIWRSAANDISFYEYDFKKLKTLLYFVSSKDYKNLKKVLGERDFDFSWPLISSGVTQLSFDQFKTDFKSRINQLKWVEKQEEKIVNLLNQNEYIDFTYKEIQSKEELSFGLDTIKPAERSYYILYKKLLKIHENHSL